MPLAVFRCPFGAAKGSPKKRNIKKRERPSTDIEHERSCTESTAAYPPAAASPTAIRDALASARSKIDRLRAACFALSRNDRKIIVYGQFLTTLASARDAANFAALVEGELARDAGTPATASNRPQQQELFERV